MGQKTGMAATVAIITAIASFILTLIGHPVFGLLTALTAVVAGIFGLIMAASPKVSGGIISIASIVLGIFGIGLSVLGMIGVIIF